MNKTAIITLLEEYKSNEARLKLNQIELNGKKRKLNSIYENKYNVKITAGYMERWQK